MLNFSADRFQCLRIVKNACKKSETAVGGIEMSDFGRKMGVCTQKMVGSSKDGYCGMNNGAGCLEGVKRF